MMRWLWNAKEGVLGNAKEEDEVVLRREGRPILLVPVSDLTFVYIGTKGEEELALAIAARAFLRSLKGTFKRPPTESLIFDGYTKVAAILDEIVFAGVIENLQEDVIRRGTKLKLSMAD